MSDQVGNSFFSSKEKKEKKVPQTFYQRNHTWIDTAGALTVATGAVVAAGTFLYFRFHIAEPHKVLVKMGLFVPGNGIAFGLRMYQFPFQRINAIDMTPKGIHLNIRAMTNEKIEFNLPCVFTCGPYSPSENPELFLNYPRRLFDASEDVKEQIIRGVIEGETRVLTAKMSAEEVFSNRDEFRHQVTERVQKELEIYGLKLFGANVKEMEDFDKNNRYFESRKQRAVETASNEAKVDVSRAQADGAIGVKLNEAHARAETSKQEATAVLAENEQQKLMIASTTEVEVTRSQNDQMRKVAAYAADVNAEQTKTKLLRELAKEQNAQWLEEMRAKEYTKTVVEAEQAVRKAEGDAQKAVKDAEGAAQALVTKAEGDAMTAVKRAEGDAQARRLMAEAALFASTKEAEGIRLMLEAQATGLSSILKAAGNSTELATFYLGKDRLLPELAKYQAEAVKGMQPKVNLWNTGSASSNDLTKFMQGLAPLADGLITQTGIGKLLESKLPN